MRHSALVRWISENKCTRARRDNLTSLIHMSQNTVRVNVFMSNTTLLSTAFSHIKPVLLAFTFTYFYICQPKYSSLNGHFWYDDNTTATPVSSCLQVEAGLRLSEFQKAVAYNTTYFDWKSLKDDGLKRQFLFLSKAGLAILSADEVEKVRQRS